VRLASTLFGTACSETTAARPEAPAGDETPVAEVNGKPISRAEVEKRASGALDRLRDEEYQARRRAVDELVMDRILDDAAAARGISREELLRQEVEQKVAVPEAAQVEAVYQQNKDRIGPHTKADVLPRIVAAMMDDRRAERAQAFMQELRGQAKVRVLLEQPRSTVAIPAGTPVLGPEKAPVTIVEFSDYLCPYCQRAEATVNQVLEKYKGKVRFVHQDFLLGRPRSLAVARSAHCAGEQGKFWEYRDDLLRRPGDWSDADLVKRTPALGLDAAAFRTCLASDRHDKAIHASSESGQELGVQSTPTFFVNGKRLTGARGMEDFEHLIDGELASGS
jgi:protein-disulfide isomerase